MRGSGQDVIKLKFEATKSCPLRKMSAEPQSIIHQVIPLEKRIFSAFSSTRVTRRNKNIENCKIPLDEVSCHTSTSCNKTVRTAHLHQDDEIPVSSDDSEPSETSIMEVPSYEERPGAYRTITQNDFFAECLAEEEDACTTFIHFFSEEQSEQREMLDDEFSKISQTHARCKLLRINGKLAPFLAAKLRIRTFPAAVVMQHGTVVDCLPGFDKSNMCVLQEWLNWKYSYDELPKSCQIQISKAAFFFIRQILSALNVDLAEIWIHGPRVYVLQSNKDHEVIHFENDKTIRKPIEANKKILKNRKIANI